MAITIPFELNPGISDRVITEAKYIKGSFIFVNSTTDLDSLITESGDTNRVADGTPVFVIEEQKIYSFESGVESHSNLKSVDFLKTSIDEDNKTYAWKNGAFYDITDLLDSFETKENVSQSIKTVKQEDQKYTDSKVQEESLARSVELEKKLNAQEEVNALYATDENGYQTMKPQSDFVTTSVYNQKIEELDNRFKGEWVKSTVYNKADIVNYTGSLYYCRTMSYTSETVPPEDITNWDLYLAKGLVQLTYKGATLTLSDSQTVEDCYNDFNRTPIIGDIFLAPASDEEHAYLATFSVTDVEENQATITKNSALQLN